MIARGPVPVGAPVDSSGAATADLAAMAGIAGRVRGDQLAWPDGADFPLVTDKECLIVLVGPAELPDARGVPLRFAAHDTPYVTLRGGRIAHVHGGAHG